MAMKYFREHGKRLTHPHCIKMFDDTVWKIYNFNTTPFSHWLRPEVQAWLDALPSVPKYSWMPRWSPYNPSLPAYSATRPYHSLKLVIAPRKGYPAGYDQQDIADLRFATREDAMMFKLVWA